MEIPIREADIRLTDNGCSNSHHIADQAHFVIFKNCRDRHNDFKQSDWHDLLSQVGLAI